MRYVTIRRMATAATRSCVGRSASPSRRPRVPVASPVRPHRRRRARAVLRDAGQPALSEHALKLAFQGAIDVSIPSDGHEAAQIASMRALRPSDPGRTCSIAAAGGVRARHDARARSFSTTSGAADGPSSGGKNLAGHWAKRELNLMSISGSVATQIPHAVGSALAARLRGEDTRQRGVFRRRRLVEVRLSRGTQLRGRAPAAGGVVLREQRHGDLGAVREAVGRAQRGRPGGRLRGGRHQRRRRRSAAGVSRHARSGGRGARGQGAGADRGARDAARPAHEPGRRDARAPRSWPRRGATIRSRGLRTTCATTACSTRRSKKYSGHAPKAKWPTPSSSPVRRLGRPSSARSRTCTTQGPEAEPIALQSRPWLSRSSAASVLRWTSSNSSRRSTPRTLSTRRSRQRRARRAGTSRRARRCSIACRHAEPLRREQAAAEALHAQLRATRTAFLRRHAAALYDALTDRPAAVRARRRAGLSAAERVPGLVPTRAADRGRARAPAEGQRRLRGRPGPLSVAGAERAALGRAPGARHAAAAAGVARAAWPSFSSTGRLDIGATTVERHGPVGYLLHGNPRFLNAEDDCDDRDARDRRRPDPARPAIEVGVMRGKVVDHPKYAGRRIFNAGHQPDPPVPRPDLAGGLLHRPRHGLSAQDVSRAERRRVLAERGRGHATKSRGSPRSRPSPSAAAASCCWRWTTCWPSAAASSTCRRARKASFPGVSNMRLWRFVGDRAARQAILFERQFAADSPAGQLICDTVVPDGEMDAALERDGRRR